MPDTILCATTSGQDRQGPFLSWTASKENNKPIIIQWVITLTAAMKKYGSFSTNADLIWLGAGVVGEGFPEKMTLKPRPEVWVDLNWAMGPRLGWRGKAHCAWHTAEMLSVPCWPERPRTHWTDWKRDSLVRVQRSNGRRAQEEAKQKDRVGWALETNDQYQLPNVPCAHQKLN